MSSPGHLDNHHRNTLRQVFEHPASHNVEWRAVLSLIEAVGSVEHRHNGVVAVTVGAQHAFFDPKGRKDVDADTLTQVRRLLTAAGYSSK
jgi:hypothetical protein